MGPYQTGAQVTIPECVNCCIAFVCGPELPCLRPLSTVSSNQPCASVIRQLPSVDQIDLFDSCFGMSRRSLIVEHQQGNHGNERLRVALLSSSCPILGRTTIELWVSCLMQSNVKGTLMQFPLQEVLQEVQMIRGTTPCYHASAPSRLECGCPIHAYIHIHPPLTSMLRSLTLVGQFFFISLYLHLANEWGQAVLSIFMTYFASWSYR